MVRPLYLRTMADPGAGNLGVGLDAPGDLADEVGPVACPAGLPVQLGVAIGQLARGHPIQGGDFGCELVHHVAPPERVRDAARLPAGR